MVSGIVIGRFRFTCECSSVVERKIANFQVAGSFPVIRSIFNNLIDVLRKKFRIRLQKIAPSLSNAVLVFNSSIRPFQGSGKSANLLYRSKFREMPSDSHGDAKRPRSNLYRYRRFALVAERQPEVL